MRLKTAFQNVFYECKAHGAYHLRVLDVPEDFLKSVAMAVHRATSTIKPRSRC